MNVLLTLSVIGLLHTLTSSTADNSTLPSSNATTIDKPPVDNTTDIPIKLAAIDPSRWETDDQCNKLETGWDRVSKNSKFVSNSEWALLSPNELMEECGKLSLTAPGIAHVQDWKSLQKFAIKIHSQPGSEEHVKKKGRFLNLFVLSDIVDYQKQNWVHNNGKTPFALWHLSEPNRKDETCSDVFMAIKDNPNQHISLHDDLCGSVRRNFTKTCQYPVNSKCYENSEEETQAKSLGLYKDELLDLGSTENYAWSLGTQQKNFMDAVKFCKSHHAQLWDANVTLTAKEEWELYNLIKPKLDKMGDLYPEKMFHSSGSNVNDLSGKIRYLSSACQKDVAESCFKRKSGKQAFAQHFVVCFVEIEDCDDA